MTYSEDEIKKYLSILQNVNDGLDVYTPVIDKHLPPKIPQKVSCENCGNTHFFHDGTHRISIVSTPYKSLYKLYSIPNIPRFNPYRDSSL